MKLKMSTEHGNKALSDPQFGQKMHDLLGQIKAEAAYLCGETVMQVYVSDLSLEREEFKVCVGADFEEIKRMTQGHMQVADLCKLGS